MNKEIDLLLRSSNRDDVILGMRLALETMDREELLEYFPEENDIIPEAPYQNIYYHEPIVVETVDKKLSLGLRYIQLGDLGFDFYERIKF